MIVLIDAEISVQRDTIDILEYALQSISCLRKIKTTASILAINQKRNKGFII